MAATRTRTVSAATAGAPTASTRRSRGPRSTAAFMCHRPSGRALGADGFGTVRRSRMCAAPVAPARAAIALVLVLEPLKQIDEGQAPLLAPGQAAQQVGGKAVGCLLLAPIVGAESAGACVLRAGLDARHHHRGQRPDPGDGGGDG